MSWEALLSEHEHINVDLGHDHALSWLVDGGGDDGRVGAVVYHRSDTTETGWCAGSVRWAPTVWEREHPDQLSVAERARARARWTLESAAADEHLTISPSLLCSCGDHGFIRDGKWVPA